jgi:uncharacterized protein (TIGR00730 family)
VKVEKPAQLTRVAPIDPVERAPVLPSSAPPVAEAPVPSGASAQHRLAHKNPEAKSLAELRLAAKQPALDEVFETHIADFKLVMRELRDQPPSIVFFGGARLKEGDPYYALAQAWGQALADEDIPPKTGAGPGAMHAIPEAYVVKRGPLVDENSRTLGFNIHLPKEQHVSASIEEAHEVQLFAFRKLALYENVRGVVVFPGGFGTLDELMEVLVLRAAGRSRDPIVLAGEAYWAPILDALRTQAVRTGNDMLAGLLDGVLVTDDPKKGLRYVVERQAAAFESDPDALEAVMVKELRMARAVATSLPAATTFLGGAQLAHDDPAKKLGDEIARFVAEQGSPVRASDAASALAAAKSVGGSVQHVEWTPHDDVDRGRHHGTVATFSERIPHKEVLLRNADAYVALPDLGRGFDEVSSLLCQIQTGKLPKKPVVLVDKQFWTPIIAAWKTAMLGEGRGYIEPEDLHLFTMVDTLDEAKAALAAG